MTMPIFTPVTTAPPLTKLRNLNNSIEQKYFAQVSEWKDNWMEMIGKISEVQHHEIKHPVFVELVSIRQIYGYELTHFDMSFYINDDNVPTLAQLCGFDENNFKSYQFYTGDSGKSLLGLYIFKNLNF